MAGREVTPVSHFELLETAENNRVYPENLSDSRDYCFAASGRYDGQTLPFGSMSRQSCGLRRQYRAPSPRSRVTSQLLQNIPVAVAIWIFSCPEDWASIAHAYQGRTVPTEAMFPNIHSPLCCFVNFTIQRLTQKLNFFKLKQFSLNKYDCVFLYDAQNITISIINKK